MFNRRWSWKMANWFIGSFIWTFLFLLAARSGSIIIMGIMLLLAYAWLKEKEG